MSKTYKVERITEGTTRGAHGDVICTVETDSGDVYPLRHWKLHSGAFEMSYAGSGPADLALAILLDHFNEWPSRDQMDHGQSRAWQLHQAFKRDFVASADEPGFTLTSEEVGHWVSVNTTGEGR